MDKIGIGMLAYHFIDHISRSTLLRIGNTCKFVASIDPIGMGRLAYHLIAYMSRSTLLRSVTTR